MPKDHYEKLWDKYELIVKLYIYHISNYWKVYSLFLVIMGLLFAGFIQIRLYDIHFASGYCVIGMLFAYLWMKVTRRNIVYAEIAEDMGRNIEKDMYENKMNHEKFADRKFKSKIRNGDWEREKDLVGLGYFQATQRILHHETSKEEKDNLENSWIYKRYDSRFERYIISRRKAVKITSINIPSLFLIIWFAILLYINWGWIISTLSDISI